MVGQNSIDNPFPIVLHTLTYTHCLILFQISSEYLVSDFMHSDWLFVIRQHTTIHYVLAFANQNAENHINYYSTLESDSKKLKV